MSTVLMSMLHTYYTCASVTAYEIFSNVKFSPSKNDNNIIKIFTLNPCGFVA